MKKLVFSTLLFLAYFPNYSQAPTMVSGDIIDRKDFRENDMGYTHYIKGSIDMDGRQPSNIFFDLKTRTAFVGLDTDDKKQYRLGVLKDYVTLSGTKTLNAEVPGLKSETFGLEGIFEIKGRKFIFYTAYHNNQGALYVNEVSESFVILGSPIKLINLDRAKNVVVIPSQNRKSLLVLQVNLTSKEPIAISCSVFDENLSELWQRDLPVAGVDKDTRLRAVDIDDAGNVYALTYQGKEKNQQASLHHYFWKAKEYKQTVLGKPGGKVYGCILRILRGTHPAVAGLYQTKNALEYFLTRVDTGSGQVGAVFSRPLPENYTKLMKNFYQPEFFSVSQMIMTDQSNIALTVEGNIVRVKDNVFYTYHSGSILVESVDSKGNMLWQKIIYKRQSVPAIPFTSSHALLANEEGVHIIYNDHKSNFSLEENDDDVAIFKGFNASVVIQSIDFKGRMSKQSIDTGQPDEFGINPKYMVKIHDNLHQTQLWRLKGMKVLFCYSTIDIK